MTDQFTDRLRREFAALDVPPPLDPAAVRRRVGAGARARRIGRLAQGVLLTLVALLAALIVVLLIAPWDARTDEVPVSPLAPPTAPGISFSPLPAPTQGPPSGPVPSPSAADASPTASPFTPTAAPTATPTAGAGSPATPAG